MMEVRRWSWEMAWVTKAAMTVRWVEGKATPDMVWNLLNVFQAVR